MDKGRRVEQLNDLVEKTKNERQKWFVLDGGTESYELMGWIRQRGFFLVNDAEIQKNTISAFDTHGVFWSKSEQTYFVLDAPTGKMAKLFVIEIEGTDVLLTADEYGQYITRLLNLVEDRALNMHDYEIDTSSLQPPSDDVEFLVAETHDIERMEGKTAGEERMEGVSASAENKSTSQNEKKSWETALSSVKEYSRFKRLHGSELLHACREYISELQHAYREYEGDLSRDCSVNEAFLSPDSSKSALARVLMDSSYSFNSFRIDEVINAKDEVLSAIRMLQNFERKQDAFASHSLTKIHVESANMRNGKIVFCIKHPALLKDSDGRQTSTADCETKYAVSPQS